MKKKLRTALCAVVFGVALLALPASASAEQFCYGSLKAGEAPAEEGAVQPATFRFSCREPVKDFLMMTSTELSLFPASVDVMGPDGTTLSPTDRFNECEGEQPATWFACRGTYETRGNWVVGSIEPTEGACARNASKRIVLSATVVVNDPRGRLSAFPLSKVRGCPKPGRSRKGD